MPDPAIFTSVINAYLPEPHASLLNGILFGVSIRNTGEFYKEVRTVGLLHLVVLSGMNITILASIIGLLTQSFSKRISLLITVLTIIIFIIFVGPKAPIVRAGIMGVLTFVAIAYGRNMAALYALIISALCIGIIAPEWLTTISFQLSFGATLGIILFGRSKSQQAKSAIGTFRQTVWNELRPSLAAQLFTVPIIFFYFREISFIAPLSNLFVAPLVPPLMIFGFLTAILGKIHFFLGLIPSFVCFGITSYMILVIEILSHVPYALVSFK